MMSCDKSSRQKTATSWLQHLRHAESPRPVSTAPAGLGGGESSVFQRRPNVSLKVSSSAAVELDYIQVPGTEPAGPQNLWAHVMFGTVWIVIAIVDSVIRVTWPAWCSPSCSKPCHRLQCSGVVYTVSQKKMHLLWNGIARNYKDRFWYATATLEKYSKCSRLEFVLNIIDLGICFKNFTWSKLTRLLNTASNFALFSVSGLKDEKLLKSKPRPTWKLKHANSVM